MYLNVYILLVILLLLLNIYDMSVYVLFDRCSSVGKLGVETIR